MKENILEQCPPPVSPSSPSLPVGLLRLLPCCLRLASLRMSMIKVANSRALKRANFCRPCEEKGPDRHEGPPAICYNHSYNIPARLTRPGQGVKFGTDSGG